MNGRCFKNWQHMSLHGEMLMILPLKKKMSFLKKTKKLANVEYAKELHKKHNELPFLAERMKIENVGKLPSLKDKKTYVVHIKNLNQVLKHDLKLKKMHQDIRFEQS